MNDNIMPMTFIPPICHPMSGIPYNVEGFKKCLQIEFNKDGSADVYDYNTCKHLKHYK